MKFVHSFWSKPFLHNKFKKIQELLPVILTDYAYSAICIKDQGHSIRLFADEKGAEILSFIPYDEVVILNDIDDESIHFAAQIKFDALYHMGLDEILIDGDLFIQKPEAFERIESLNQDFVYSFYEPNKFILCNEERIDYNIKLYASLIPYYDVFNNGVYTLDDSIYSYEYPNTSLMKFNNQELKTEYMSQYVYHKHLLKDAVFDKVWPDIILEQRNMDKLLKYKKYTSAPIIEDYPEEQANDYALSIGYTHLGGQKSDYQDYFSMCLQMRNPELYRRTLEQIDKYKGILS